MANKITDRVVRKLLKTVDAGLVAGMGWPAPGQMCVEAAVCYAMGLPHGDRPTCVSEMLRNLKIGLNDSGWSSKLARAKGMRRLAVAQLGSADALDEREFCRRVRNLIVSKYVPLALRSAASVHPIPKYKDELEAAATAVETNKTAAAMRKAIMVAVEAADAADDERLAILASDYIIDVGLDDYMFAAGAGAYAHDADDRDRILSEYAEEIVQILIDMNAPGCRWLWLTE